MKDHFDEIVAKRREELTSQERKERPIFSGVLKYFPDALLEVAELSRIANEKHNPGQPLHWSKGKSNDHGDALVRHQLDAGKWDELEGQRVRHSAEVAWRALAQLQTEIEAERERVNPYLPEEVAKAYEEQLKVYKGQQPVVEAQTMEGDFDKMIFAGTAFTRDGYKPI